MKNLWIALAAIFGLFQSGAAQCNGEGWQHEFEGHCYYVSYTGEDSELTWHEARDLCLNGGGELASLNSYEEEQFLLSAVGETGFGGNLWIGLNRIDDWQNDYVWSDGTTGTYRAYAEGQPVDPELKQCIYFGAEGTGDCFDRYDGKDAIDDLLSSPGQADGVNTFHFGSRDEDVTGQDWCEEECKNKEECVTYTFYSNYDPRSDWKGHCIGKTDFDDTWESYIYSNSGKRTQCSRQKADGTSGLWFSSNCGLPFGVACKKPSGSDGPNTLPPTPVEDSYCPKGYFNIGGGNKCYKVEVFDNDQSDGPGLTWDEAVDFCRTGPGSNPDLASISSDEENSVIMSQIQGYKFGAWIGLHRDLSGSWIWTDNSNPDYFNWNTSPDADKDCVEMHVNENGPGYDAGKWITRGCTSYRGYACQTFKDPDNPVATPEATTPHECASGWIPYWHSCYKLDTTQRSFEEAKEYCRSQASTLASIHTAAENSAIHAHAQGQLPIWIGLQQHEDGEYRWTDNTVGTYTNWAPGGVDGGEGCVQMLSNGEWNDTACWQKLPSLCEIMTDDSIVLTTPPAAQGVCPSVEWKEWGDQCYYFNTEDQTNNWDDALEECKYLAGRNYETSLVSIHSHAETSMLVEEMQQRLDSGSAWIGLSRQTSSDPWQWEDGSLFQYSLWAPNEPNGGSERMCVRMYINKFAGSWDDAECTAQQYYICKATKIPEPTTATVPPTGSQSCPSAEWEKYGSDCFLFRPDHYRTWSEAVAECSDETNGQGTLASIHSGAENWWIHSRLTEISEQPLGQNYWLGMRKEGPMEDHPYYWIDGSPMDYEYWSYGEPNDEAGDENCVEMWQDTAEWNDHDCGLDRGYVCKWVGETDVIPDTTPDTGNPGDDGSGGGGVSGGMVAGIIIGVLVLAVVAGGIVYYVKKRAYATPSASSVSENGLNDKVSFNNPLSKDPSPTYDNLYENDFSMPRSTGVSQNEPTVQGGVLFLGSDA